MKNPIAYIFMENKEEIIIELYPDFAPNTVNSFIYLANNGYFNNHKIERIVPGYVVDISYTAFGREECKYLIENEAKISNIPAKPGFIGMGGYDDGISGGEFFFPLSFNEKIDGNYPIFGKVIQNWEEIKRWENVPLKKVIQNFGIEINEPIKPIVIKEVKVETFGQEYPLPIKKSVKAFPENWKY